MNDILVRIFDKADNRNISLLQVYYGFSVIVFLRNFLEKILGATHRLGVAPGFYYELCDYIHVYLYFTSVFLLLLIALSICCRISLSRAAKISVLLAPVILLPPIIDYAVYGGSVSLYQFQLADVPLYFANMLNPFANELNISAGARVEILVVVLMMFLVSRIHFKRSIPVSLMTAAAGYCIICWSGFIPAYFKAFVFQNSEQYQLIIANTHNFALQFVYVFLLLLLFFAGKLWFENGQLVKDLLSLLYVSRLLFYLFLLSFGYAYAGFSFGDLSGAFHFIPFTQLLAACLFVACLFVHAKLVNDTHDLAIDKISNSNRAVASGRLTLEHIKLVKTLAIAFAFIFLLLSSNDFAIVYAAAGVAALSHLYSVPPFRLRRFYPLGLVTLAFIGMLLFICGICIMYPGSVFSLAGKSGLILYIGIMFFVLSHFKDFKDLEGDSRNGIKTLFSYIQPGLTVATILLLTFSLLLSQVLQIMQIPAPYLWAGGSWIIGMVVILSAKEIGKYDHIFYYNSFYLLLIGAYWLLLYL